MLRPVICHWTRANCCGIALQFCSRSELGGETRLGNDRCDVLRLPGHTDQPCWPGSCQAADTWIGKPDQLYADRRLKSRLLRLDGWRVHFFKWLISLTIHFAMDIYWMVISTKAQLVRPPCALTLFVVFNVFTFLELFARLFACKYFHCACINLECRMRRFFGYGLSFGASLSMFIKLYK